MGTYRNQHVPDAGASAESDTAEAVRWADLSMRLEWNRSGVRGMALQLVQKQELGCA